MKKIITKTIDIEGFKKGISFGLGIIFTLATSAILAVAVTGTINTFSSGNVVDAAQINTNFDTIKTAVQGIVSSQWTSSGSNIYYNSGNVGIGTNNPSAPLEVSTSSLIPQGSSSINLKGDNNTERFQVTSGMDAGFQTGVYGGSFSSMTAVTAGRALGFFLAGGYDGTNPYFYNYAGMAIFSDENFTSIAHGSSIRFSTTNLGSAVRTDKVTISANGNIGIGTSSPTALLHVAGTAGNTSGTWSNLSDEKLKKNIFDYKGSLEKVLNLRPVSFEWKENKEGRTAGRHIGFIAQEVEKVFPEWVSTMSDGNKWMTPEGMNAVLVQSIRELKERHDSVKTHCNASLSSAAEENAKLKEEIKSLKDSHNRASRQLEERLNVIERMVRK